MALQSWLILNSLRLRDPERLAGDLRQLSAWRSYSNSTDETLKRWDDALGRWSRWRGRREASARELLREGRKRFYEAAGYDRIGRAYDATALYLWAADALLLYLDREEPAGAEVPEALFLLGNIFIRHGTSLPRSFKADRLHRFLLNTYPETIWAERARSLRHEIQGGADAV